MNKKRPGSIFIPGAGRHQLAVLQVVSRDQHGRPLTVHIIHPEQVVNVEHDDDHPIKEFVTAYVNKHVYEKKR